MSGAVWSASAWADYRGEAVCEQATESCEISASSEKDSGGDLGDDVVSSGTAGSTGAAPDDPFAGWDCEYKLLESDAESDARAGDRPSPDHQLMQKTCTDPETGTSVQERTWVAPGEGGTPIDPAVLAAEAVDNLVLPTPQIAVSPADFQLVQLPVWLWLEGSSWQDQSASASVPGLAVIAIAEPVRARWVMGDGSTVMCEGAGTKWTPAYGADEDSPTCGHTYTRSSAGAPGGEFAVTVTVEWAVSWSGGGASGMEPGMTTTAATSWPVAQSQSLVK